MKHTNFCIIGAGVIGCAIARELSRYQYSVLVVEKGNDVSLGCSKANSGILHGGYDSSHGTLKGKLEHKGNALYDRWNDELEFGLDRCGSLVLAFSKEEEQSLQKLKLNGEKNGVNGLEIISKQEILEQEPNVNPEVLSALQCRHSGIVSPYEVTIALAENAMHNGVEILFNTKVQKISKTISPRTQKNSWLIEGNSDSTEASILADYVINCAGVFSDEIAGMIGINMYSITPRRGSYYVFQRGYLPVNKVLFQTPSAKGKGVLVSPTYHGNLIIGPDSNTISDKEDTRTSKESLEFIEQLARLTYPELDMRKAIRTYSGIRPTASTKDFIINMDDENFVNLVGIDSPGLTSAPAIAQYCIELLRQHNCILQERNDFDPHRKKIIERQKNRAFLDMKEVNKLAHLESSDPSKITCRCEQVYEKTIVEAIKREPHPLSIDAVKRRTRASMGICQGRFCRPRVREILARELGVNPQNIAEK